MRPFRFALAACLPLVVLSAAAAQFGGLRPKVRIENPRVGFRPAGGRDDAAGFLPQFVSKSGAWAPVWFNLEILGETERGMRLEVTAADGDGFRTLTSVPILRRIDTKAGEQPRPKETRVEFAEMLNAAYVRVGGQAGEVKLQVVSDDDDRVTLSESATVTTDRGQSGSGDKYVVLSLGTTIPNFGFKPRDPKDGAFRNGRVVPAKVESLQEMPDQWFGYDAADLVILGTGKADKQFIADLFDSASAQASRKRWALFEWVRRGGKLVISVGERAEEVRKSAVFEDVLPVAIGPKALVPELKSGQFGAGAFTTLDLRYRAKADQKAEPFPVAALAPKPGRGATVLLSDATGKQPLVVQAPLGLGRVTAVGFDLDRSPFVDDPVRAEFWDWLVENAGAERAARPSPRAANANLGGNATLPGLAPEDGAAAAVRSNVDAFEGVPVISFGWVALFILGYTLLIGPVEYLFLKKVLGKLELTWVTFPLIVLTVSAAAYFTAYAVKGKDLRVNKIDVVDIDARDGGRLYGRTWFTIFSPRIDSYTIGVEPKDNWAKQPATGPTAPTLVDWFGNTGGVGQIGGSSRGYRYQFDLLNDDGRPTGPANGLAGVPIQVWSTKAFTASWSGVPAGPLPPVTADLTHPADGKKDAVFGEITLNLPVKDVQEAYLLYRGAVYELDRGIATGVPVRINTRTALDPTQSPLNVDDRVYAAEREDAFGNAGNLRGRGRPQQAAVIQTGPLPLWGILFHEEATGGGRELQNASLRMLDQSWRLDERNTDEVIVLIRLKRVNGEAEELLGKPDTASPTSLWLKGLPGSGPRPEVLGKLQQDTYLRFFIPVKPAGGR